MAADESNNPTARSTWRVLRPIRSPNRRWRTLVDSRLERLRVKSPGLVEDSWWLATLPPSSIDSLSLDSLELVRNPRGSFLADPMPLAGTEDEYLVEQYQFSRKKGVVSHLRFDKDGKARLLEGIIDEPFHLSFPMSFIWDEKTWIVCEAAASGETHIWEYDTDRGTSRRCDPIFDFPLRDTSIFTDGRKWYLLATVAEPSWELVMYSSDNPISGWTRVPLENRSSVFRLAGNPIPEAVPSGTEADDTREWIVPLQGSARGYGSEVEICRLRLTDGSAVLEPGFQINPPDPYIGFHTIAPGKSQVVVDIKYLKVRRDRLGHRFRPRRLLNRLSRVGGSRGS